MIGKKVLYSALLCTALLIQGLSGTAGHRAQAKESNYQPITLSALSDTEYNVYSTEY